MWYVFFVNFFITLHSADTILSISISQSKSSVFVLAILVMWHVGLHNSPWAEIDTGLQARNHPHYKSLGITSVLYQLWLSARLKCLGVPFTWQGCEQVYTTSHLPQLWILAYEIVNLWHFVTKLSYFSLRYMLCGVQVIICIVYEPFIHSSLKDSTLKKWSDGCLYSMQYDFLNCNQFSAAERRARLLKV